MRTHIIHALLAVLLIGLSATVDAQLPRRDCEDEAEKLVTPDLIDAKNEYLANVASLQASHIRREGYCYGDEACIKNEKEFTQELFDIYYEQWQDKVNTIERNRQRYIENCQLDNVLIAAEYCAFNPHAWDCQNYNDPLVLDIAGDGFRFTDLAIDPVLFDLDNDGNQEETAWTEAGSDDAFLVFDRNDNDEVDDGSELFGNHTMMLSGDPALNGFVALAELDSPDWGGNGDGFLSKDDDLFKKLALWTDKDHDGETDKGEIRKLKKEIEIIDLAYVYVLELGPNSNAIPFHSVATTKSSKGKKGKSGKSNKGKSGKEQVVIDIVDVFFNSSEIDH